MKRKTPLRSDAGRRRARHASGDRAEASRRDLLKASGVAAGTLLLDACARRDRVFIEQQLERSSTPPGAARWRLGVCGQCEAACGLEVRLIDGEAKKIEGNPEHPASRGGVCALGHAALQELYHPDRITTPLRRRAGAGPEQGADAFEPATWEEALAAIGATLAAARERTPAGVAIVRRDSGSIEDALWDRFAAALGAPPAILDEPFDRTVERAAAELLFGRSAVPHYRLGGADLVLAIGAAPADRWRAPVAYARALTDLRARGGLYVHAEARLSASAGLADLWLPIRPGTEGILARTLAATLLDGGAAADDEDLAERVRQLLGSETPALEEAAALCDVDARRLRFVAERLRAARQPVVMAGGGAALGRDGLALVLVGLALHLLAGSPPARGAGLALEQSPWEATEAIATGAPEPLQRLVGRLESAHPPDVVFVVECDPVHRAPAGWRLEERLGRAGSVIALSTLLTDTARRADWILPLQTDLERYRAAATQADAGPVVSLAPPVRAATGEARHPGDLALALAATQDGLAPALPFSDVEDAATKLLAADPRFVPVASSARRVLRRAARAGFLQGTASPLPRLHEAAELPATSPPDALAHGGHLYLVPFDSVKSADGRGASRPWLQELPDPHAQVMWETWAEVAPADAARLGLATGERVRIVSAAGAIEVAVFVSPATRPGTVAVPLGHGHREHGRWASGRGANVSALLTGEPVVGADAPVLLGVAVTLERANDTRPVAILARGLRGQETLPRGWGAHGIGAHGSGATGGDADRAGSGTVAGDGEARDGEEGVR